MTRFFTCRFLIVFLFVAAICGGGSVFAQEQTNSAKKDSVPVTAPFKYTPSNNDLARLGIFEPDPPNLVRTFVYDAATNRYILYERIG
ncbi:MAG: hypothetical protein JWR67_1550, partial [Mucilaginibacter sp.]|nr:hypothetical protein [Mucilaginibacter sp.]